LNYLGSSLVLCKYGEHVFERCKLEKKVGSNKPSCEDQAGIFASKEIQPAN
jgi:hypothetical protein